MPRVHNVAARLKRWLLVGCSELFRAVFNIRISMITSIDYLDEFTFRFNRRRSNTRRLLFYRLAQQAAVATSRHRTTPLFKGSHQYVREGDTHLL